MLARVLVTTASAIMLALGSLHLLYTFSGDALTPREAAVQAAMQASTLVLTAETTMWRAWLGFNASHSLCAIFFGLVYGFLAFAQPALLARSAYLQILGLAWLAGFAGLARLYWFSVPLIGVGLAFAAFAAGIAVLRFGRRPSA